jgi:hypothetical protein
LIFKAILDLRPAGKLFQFRKEDNAGWQLMQINDAGYDSASLMRPVMPDGNTHSRKFRHPAQVEITLSGAMEVRAARGQQSEALRMTRKQQGLFSCMA